MLKAWMITDSYILLPNFVPSALVVMRTTIVGSHHPPQAINAQGTSLLTTARAGSVSLCFKNDKAQTFGHQAPGCENELSGLDPANRAAFSFNEGHTETKGYSGGIGLCQLTEKHGIKTPTGSDTFPGHQSTNYVKEPRRTASHARSSLNLEDGIVLIMGDSNDRST